MPLPNPVAVAIEPSSPQGRRADSGDGREASHYFRVDTADKAAALNAAGLPRVGESFPGDPSLRVVRRSAESSSGADTGSGNGWTTVRVDYATPGGGGQPEPRTPGTAPFTEVEFGLTPVRVLYGTDYETQGGGGPAPSIPVTARAINGGQGVDIEQPTMTLRVHLFRAVNATIDLQAAAELLGTVNDAPVVLPPLYQSGGVVTFGPGTLLAMGFSAAVDGESLHLIYELRAARDHRVRWYTENPDGSPGQLLSAVVRPVAAFPAFV